jgi:hypothetical protein
MDSILSTALLLNIEINFELNHNNKGNLINQSHRVLHEVLQCRKTYLD